MRILISIGCNDYQHLDKLYGAEQDARDVFDVLTQKEDYDRKKSRLLLSPTYGEIIAALDEVLSFRSLVEVFTLLFAGHGGVKQGNYYLCAKDTHSDRLSTTALPLVTLFTIISEKRPLQANVILDACQAGGAMRDTAALMKPEIIGDIEASSVSLLAACALSQYASEENGNGILTSELLRCLNGAERIQDTKPYLDLVEVGRSVSDRVQQKSADQRPVCWGLNLFGQSKFARNPHFCTNGSTAFPSFLQSISPESSVGQTIATYSEALWAEYKQATKESDYRRLLNLLSTVCTELENKQQSCVPFIRGVATSLSNRSVSSPDLLAQSDVMACSAVSLLPVVEQNEKRALVRDFLRERSFFNADARIALDESLKSNRYALLSNTAGPSDFYYLPIRISKTLGWLGSDIIIDNIFEGPDKTKLQSIRALSERIIDTYAKSLTAMSDQQAPYLYMFVKACIASGWHDLASSVVTSVYESFVSVEGNITKVDLEPSKVFDYTIARAFGETIADLRSIAKPSQLLAVLMLCADSLGLADSLDKRLISLDHKSTNIFLPDRYLDFAAEIIHEGVNYTFTIGHDVWTLKDLREMFEKRCRVSIQDNESLRIPEVKALGVLSSSLFPNRIPFFLEYQ